MRLETVPDATKVQTSVTLLLFRGGLTSLEVESKTQTISLRRACNTSRLEEVDGDPLELVPLARTLTLVVLLSTFVGVIFTSRVRAT